MKQILNNINLPFSTDFVSFDHDKDYFCKTFTLFVSSNSHVLEIFQSTNMTVNCFEVNNSIPKLKVVGLKNGIDPKRFSINFFQMIQFVMNT